LLHTVGVTEWLAAVLLPMALAVVLVVGSRKLWSSGRTQRAVAVAILIPIPVVWSIFSVLWLLWGVHDPWFNGTAGD